MTTRVKDLKQDEGAFGASESHKRRIGAGERAANAVALAFVAVVVCAFTVGKRFVRFGPLWDPSVHVHRSVDLVLFNGFDHPPVWWGPWTNLFGNVILFVPLGFLIANLLRGRARFPVLKATLQCFIASLAIEVAQYVLAAGYSDVDDLLFNTVGGAIGALLVARMGRKWRALFVALAVVAAIGALTVMLSTSVF